MFIYAYIYSVYASAESEMIMMKYLMSILVITLVVGCVDDNKKTNYALVELSDLHYTIAEKKIELGNTPPVESLYYSPGVDVL